MVLSTKERKQGAFVTVDYSVGASNEIVFSHRKKYDDVAELSSHKQSLNETSASLSKSLQQNQAVKLFGAYL